MKEIMEILQNILETINYIRANNSEEPITNIAPEMSLRDDYGLDSLDLAEFTVRIEDKYGVDVFEEGVIDTINEVLNIINND